MPLSQSPTLSTRLASLAQRLGLIGRSTRQILQRASTLELPFRPIARNLDSICWLDGPPLHRFVDLPRGALSGPVQEDKEQAHAALSGLVAVEQQHLQAIDLRQIDGLSSPLAEGRDYRSLEDFAASEQCKSVRIISYKDFIKTFNQALPGYQSGEAIELRQASWLGERLYWAGEQQAPAFAGAIVYARRRGLEIMLPATLTHYSLNQQALDNLQQHYHVQLMPCQAWSDPAFISLLLDNGMPYARLSLWKTPGAAELLLLPKAHPDATALGEGLQLAGAPDVLSYLRGLRS
ncbi:DUF6685 family protein [Pseudomonas sp. AA-38]|uniref:DUF6685 family protein n=1 Tax=Pseudomonas sp. AA-38 TaxID=3028807 RepID=UPI0023F618A3|nr:DUF6685 family protein [Pseudomonas sp. AA-38]